MSSDLDIAKCYKFVKEITLWAGEIIKCAFESEKVVHKKQGEWDLVINIDYKIEKMFIDGLSTEFPDHKSMGSAAMSMAYVARVAVDCIQIDGLHAWDIAAGIVIVREADGTIMETKGGVYDIMKPNTIAASNEILHVRCPN